MLKTKGDDRQITSTLSILSSWVGFAIWMFPYLGITLCSIGVFLGLLSWRTAFVPFNKVGAGSSGLAGIVLGAAGVIVQLLLIFKTPGKFY